MMWDGFRRNVVDIDGVALSVRTAGEGAPLLLLHGQLQNANAWHLVAPALAQDFRVIVPDLRGAGESGCPVPPDCAGPPDPAAWSDRRMAGDMLRLLGALGMRRVAVMAHDGGAQVALRMALDAPERVECLAVVEGVPNGALWAGSRWPGDPCGFDRLLLAQPGGLPERLIGADPDAFVDMVLAAGTAGGSVFAFHPVALASYRQQMRDPARLAALCARHRAGILVDRRRDLADAAQGRLVTMPLQLVCASGPGRRFEGGLPRAWAPWCARPGISRVESGHFVPEENPAALLKAVRAFLLGRSPVGSEIRHAA